MIITDNVIKLNKIIWGLFPLQKRSYKWKHTKVKYYAIKTLRQLSNKL